MRASTVLTSVGCLWLMIAGINVAFWGGLIYIGIHFISKFW